MALNWAGLRIRLLLGASLFAGVSISIANAAEVSDSVATSRYQDQIRPLLRTYCYDCHGGGAKEGNLALDQFATAAEVLGNRDLWWKVLKNLRAGVMPPATEKRPDQAEVVQIFNWIKFDVFQIQPDNPDPGRVTIRRLNRREYGNTVQDLMGIDFDAAILFPPDDSGYGFDNVGDALSFSPLLMEKYLRAAQAIVDQAVPKVTWMMPRQEISGREFHDPDAQVHGDSMSSKKAAKVQHTVRVTEPGKYAIEVTVRLHGSFDFDPSRYVIAFSIDGTERSKNEYGWDENKQYRYPFDADWQPGEHQFAFELIPLPDSGEKPEETGFSFSRDAKFVRFEVQSVRVEGPEGTTTRVHPARYSQFLPRENPPRDLVERRQYATEILRPFATKAFRGSVEQKSVDRLVKLAEQVYSQPDQTFEAGIAHAMVAILASPRFLFRFESAANQPGETDFVWVDELSLASRLSYFLWSTMPDEELFRLAQVGELRGQLPQQLKRMMNHDRANEFIRNFTGQWLRTRDVTQVSVDPIVVLGHQEEYEQLRDQFRSRRSRSSTRDLTPEEQKFRDRFRALRTVSDRFNDELKRSMRRETELCVEYIARENRSLLELLDCNYTFLNEKLAEHYGIPDVQGSDMRRVELPEGSPRGGVLTQASMLLVTSNPTRTSPVKRGLFILDNILGTPAPPPPALVPDLEESAKKFAGREPTLREMLSAHRENALCAGCHARMDPLGLALENYNALGMWRDQEKNQPIDASGQLITGETFKDFRELKTILKERHAADFYRCVTQKMLTYALGRGLDYKDEHTVDLIVQRLEKSGGKFGDLLMGIVESAPFQKQRRIGNTAAAKTGS